MNADCLLQPPDEANRLALYRFRSGLFRLLPTQLRDQISASDRLRLLLRVLRGYVVYYLTDGRRVSGYCFVKRNYLHKYAFMRRGDVLINPYYVSPDYRGQRISTRMVHAAISDYASKGRTVWAVVKQENTPSIRILQSLRFCHAGYSAKGLWSHHLTDQKTKLPVFASVRINFRSICMIYQIKTALRNWSDRSDVGSMVFQIARSWFARFMLILPDEQYAQWFHKLYCHTRLNLKDPKTFDEKLWWLKLNNRDPLLTRCSCKNEVRGYVKECGLEDILLEQVGIYDSADEIRFEDFEGMGEIIFKCTHGSGENYILSPGKENNIKSFRRRFNYALKQNAFWFSREWNYKNVKRRIVAEKIVRDSAGKLPLDYKFMCFDGEPKLLFLDLGLYTDELIYNEHYPRNIYDMDFQLLPVWETRPNADYEVKKPENFERMVEIARTLSQPFPHCRVDLYNLDGRIYFGEITFYHGGGCNDIQPPEWDYRIGSWIDINSPKIVRK